MRMLFIGNQGDRKGKGQKARPDPRGVFFNALRDMLVEQGMKGEKVNIPGLGTFSVRLCSSAT
jgi:nucleoid DNA-binding protein